MRHGYIPTDWHLWIDTINMATRLGVDDHAQSIVMPKDLKAIHDRLLREQNRRDREEELQRHTKDEKAFREKYGRWLGICISSGDITIKPLQNYKEFYDEGKAMHHCVATYFNRSGSLILSARQDGERIATIELSTKNFKVVQCRSHCNQKPQRYDELCGLIEANKSLFLRPHKSKQPY